MNEFRNTPVPRTEKGKPHYELDAGRASFFRNRENMHKREAMGEAGGGIRAKKMAERV